MLQLMRSDAVDEEAMHDEICGEDRALAGEEEEEEPPLMNSLSNS